MKFFNIRYECNDARDDYSKFLKQQNATDGVFPHWFRADDNDNRVKTAWDQIQGQAKYIRGWLLSDGKAEKPTPC